MNLSFKRLLMGTLMLGVITLIVHSEIIHEQTNIQNRQEEDVPAMVIERDTVMKTMRDNCPGPFTECVGKTGFLCCDLISEACSDDNVECITRAPGEMMMRNYNPNRVYVIMDENNNVQVAPSRG